MSKKLVQTSKDAYYSLDPEKINDIHKRIIDALKVIGKGHYEDISRHMKTEPQRVWRRLNELHKAGLIERTGERKALSSGRDGFVWTLTELALPKVTESILPGKSIVDYSRAIHQIPMF